MAASPKHSRGRPPATPRHPPGAPLSGVAPGAVHLGRLRRLRHSLREIGSDLAIGFEAILKFLQQEAGAIEVGVFLLAEDGEFLKERWRLRSAGAVEPGAREEPVWDGSFMRTFFQGNSNVELIGRADDLDDTEVVLIRFGGPWRAGGRLVSWVSPSANPTGVLEMRTARAVEFGFMEGLSEEVGEWLKLAILEDQVSRMAAQMGLFSELTSLFMASLRLEDRLRVIIQGIHRQFGFDRLRLYLVDQASSHLAGEMEVDLRGRVSRINAERYPIPIGQTRGLRDILWQRLRQSPWHRILESSIGAHEKIFYLALMIEAKEIGVLMVDNMVSQKPISPQARQILGSFAGQIALAVDNARLFSEVEKLSLFDPLTRLANRRHFEAWFNQELYRAYRDSQQFVLGLLDLDFFKEINDSYGHQTGDEAIVGVAGAINTATRQSDFVARWGGDEIALVLGNTAQSEAVVVIGRILDAVRKMRFIYPADPPKELSLTASIGLASYPKDGADLASLMSAADKALYHMKFKGRNGAMFFSDLPVPLD